MSENPISNFLLSNQQAKTVLYKRVKRQWDPFEENRNEFMENEYEEENDRESDLQELRKKKKR